MLKGPAYQEEIMNSTGAWAFCYLMEQQLRTHIHRNTQSTKLLNFAHLIGFSEMSLHAIRYVQECFAYQLDRWREK